MASLPACACCGDPVASAPLGLCKTCLESSGDGDGVLCQGCFVLHEKGAAGKGSTRGHAFSSTPVALDDSTATVLSSAGLTPCTTRCTIHPSEPVRVACNTCHEPALCALCAISLHAGHSLIVASEAAPAARAKLREAAAPADDSSVVNAARSHSQRVSAELSELPNHKDAAEQRIEELRNTLITAVNARCAGLTSELESSDTLLRSEIQAQLESADTLLRNAISAAEILATAADKLSDVDVVCHADALLSRASSVKEAVAALPPRPAVTGAVNIDVDRSTMSTLISSISGVGKVVTGVAALIVGVADDDTLEAKGSRVATFRESGYDVATLRAGGFDVPALRAGGFDLAALRAGGFDAATLHAGGFNVASLRAGGFDEAALLAAGLMVQRRAGPRLVMQAVDGSC